MSTIEKTTVPVALTAGDGVPATPNGAENATGGGMTVSMTQIFRSIHGEDWVPPASPPPVVLGQINRPRTIDDGPIYYPRPCRNALRFPFWEDPAGKYLKRKASEMEE